MSDLKSFRNNKHVYSEVGRKVSKRVGRMLAPIFKAYGAKGYNMDELIAMIQREAFYQACLIQLGRQSKLYRSRQ